MLADRINKICVILGNGESRLGVNYREKYPGAFVYGCNGAYKERPDVLVCSDIYMQHLIYKTGYCKDNLCYFSEWAPIPSGAAEHIISALKGEGLPVIQNTRDTTYGLSRTQAVISGCTGANYVTWVDDEDMVKSMEQMEISSGSRALLIACESGWFKEIILLGFDGMNSSNVYQNDEGYERSTPRNEWVQERQDIMDKFPDIKFNVV
jgi:hypothetical protein